MPRPAMFVAIVTAPRRPACATTLASPAASSGRALSTRWGTPKSRASHAPRSHQHGLASGVGRGHLACRVGPLCLLRGPQAHRFVHPHAGPVRRHAVHGYAEAAPQL